MGTIRYLRCYELYQMGLEKLLNLTSVTQYYLWGKVKRLSIAQDQYGIGMQGLLHGSLLFLRKTPPVVKLYVQVD